jgi:short-subunit dehydrogenase
MSAEDAAYEIYYAVMHGRNLVVPGKWNKFYVHVINKLLPEEAKAVFARVMT